MDKWELLKLKITAMSETEKLFNNEEALKVYYHILKFMEICEEK